MVEQEFINYLIKEARGYFQNLEGWIITYGELKEDGGKRYTDKCWHNGKTKIGHIYPKSDSEDLPQYIFHEMLHIALCDLRVGSYKIKRLKEEIFVQY